MRLPLPLFLAALVAVLSGCAFSYGEGACTLIGCGDSIAVDVGALADEGFAASVTSSGASGGFRCSAPSAAGIASTPTDLSGDFASEDAALVPTCTGDGFTLAPRQDAEELPASISVEATGATSGTVVSETFENIDYEVSQPNGPDCEPTCSHASLSVTG